jgi:hypothetical protein
LDDEVKKRQVKEEIKEETNEWYNCKCVLVTY